MEAFIEIYKEGSKDQKSKKSYYHLWIPDNDDPKGTNEFWDLILHNLRNIEKDRHVNAEDRFPHYMSYKDY